MRITRAWKQNKLLKFIAVIPWIIYRHEEFKYGVHISSNIEIEQGLLVVHGDGVYINTEHIGKNFTVFQNVTVGISKGSVPIIEDDVTIMPNAIVYGGVRLSKGCTVGANSVVNKDVAPYTTVVGAPAKMIKDEQK